jgi:hypothetical protein
MRSGDVKQSDADLAWSRGAGRKQDLGLDDTLGEISPNPELPDRRSAEILDLAAWPAGVLLSDPLRRSKKLNYFTRFRLKRP